MHSNMFETKRIVMTTFGSFGDLHPYIALALEMKRRDGIEPVIVTSEVYREKIESLGIEFQPMRPELPALDTEEAAQLIEKILDPKRGAEFLFKDLLVLSLSDSYIDLNKAMQGADLLISHPMTLAAPILAEKKGIPWVSTVLAPASIWSDYDPFVPPDASWLYQVMRFGGPLVARGFKKLVERMTNSWLKPLYEFRAGLGLPKAKSPIFEGQFSPELNLALFSKTIFNAPVDMPANTMITGFPFYDKKDNSSMSPELLHFLNSGPAPIVFTLGSAAVHVAGDFFRESIEAARILKRRALFLVGDEKNKPKEILPKGMAAFNYAPYGELLPRAAAMVHQGGIGTTGQGLRAGIPMLVIPFNHDQPDNAARVTRLGVARTISRKNYKAAKVVKELQELLGNPSYTRRAREIGRQVRAENGPEVAVNLILNMSKGRKYKEVSALQIEAFA